LGGASFFAGVARFAAPSAIWTREVAERCEHRRRDLAVAEEDVGLEALAGLGAQAVDDERLAVADTVLLVAEADDHVIGSHSVENAGDRPASRHSSLTGDRSGSR
jgi:hypothetical protein